MSTYRIEMFSNVAKESFFLEIKANGVISSLYIARKQCPTCRVVDSKKIM